MEGISEEWSGKTFGTGWMHERLMEMLRIVDVRIFYGFTAIFVIPFCLVFNPSGRIAYDYFRHRHNYSPLKACWSAYKNHCLFGEIVIDRFAMWAGRKFQTTLVGYDKFRNLAVKEDAFIQLSAHIGNYEVAGYSLVAESKRFNALVFGGEKETVMSNRKKIFDNQNINMIPIREDMSHIFEINACIENHETVSMPADRIHGSKKSIEKTFLGEKADFPLGPFQVATLKGLDTLAVNVLKTGWNAYTIYVTELPYDKNASRKEQIAQLSDAYIKELETRIKEHPIQWFNYFRFWKEPT